MESAGIHMTALARNVNSQAMSAHYVCESLLHSLRKDIMQIHICRVEFIDRTGSAWSMWPFFSQGTTTLSAVQGYRKLIYTFSIVYRLG